MKAYSLLPRTAFLNNSHTVAKCQFSKTWADRQIEPKWSTRRYKISKPALFKTNYIQARGLKLDHIFPGKREINQNSLLDFIKAWIEITEKYISNKTHLRKIYYEVKYLEVVITNKQLNISEIKNSFRELFSIALTELPSATDLFLKAVYFKSLQHAMTRKNLNNSGYTNTKESEQFTNISSILSFKYQDIVEAPAFNADQSEFSYTSVLMGFVEFLQNSEKLFDPLEDESWKVYFLQAAKLNNSISAIEIFLSQILKKSYFISTPELANEIINTLGTLKTQINGKLALNSFTRVCRSSLLNKYISDNHYLNNLTMFLMEAKSTRLISILKSVYLDHKRNYKEPDLKAQLESTFHKAISSIILKLLPYKKVLRRDITYILREEMDAKLGSFITRTLNQNKKFKNSFRTEVLSLGDIKLGLYVLISGQAVDFSITRQIVDSLFSFVSPNDIATMVYSKGKLFHMNNSRFFYGYLSYLNTQNKYRLSKNRLLNFEYSESEISELTTSLKWEIQPKPATLTKYDKTFRDFAPEVFKLISVFSPYSSVSGEFFARFIDHIPQDNSESLLAQVTQFFDLYISSSRNTSPTEKTKTILLCISVLQGKLKLPEKASYLTLYLDNLLKNLGVQKKLQDTCNIDILQLKTNRSVLYRYLFSELKLQESYFYGHLALNSFLPAYHKSQFTLNMHHVNETTEKDLDFSIVQVLDGYSQLGQPKIVARLFEATLELSNSSKNKIVYPYIFSNMASVLVSSFCGTENSKLSQVSALMQRLIEYSKKLGYKARKHCIRKEAWFYSYTLRNSLLQSYCKAVIDKSNIYQAMYIVLFWMPKNLGFKLNNNIYAMILNGIYTSGVNGSGIDERLIYFTLDQYITKFGKLMVFIESNTVLLYEAKQYLKSLKHLKLLSLKGKNQ